MSYLSFCVQEIELSPKRIDSSIIIIYDANEEKFYLYGDRAGYGYVPYSFVYHYTELDSLIYFIDLVMNEKMSSFTFEYNHLYIPNEDLDYVDYDYLRSKINRNNEIIAYEHIKKIDKNKLKRTLKKIYNV